MLHQRPSAIFLSPNGLSDKQRLYPPLANKVCIKETDRKPQGNRRTVIRIVESSKAVRKLESPIAVRKQESSKLLGNGRRSLSQRNRRITIRKLDPPKAVRKLETPKLLGNRRRAGVRKKEENDKIIRKLHSCKKAREQLQEKKDFCSKNVGRQYL